MNSKYGGIAVSVRVCTGWTVDGEFEDQKRVMNLSLWVAVLLLGTKVTAAALTGSSAIYSDAAESVVHLLAVAFAVWKFGNIEEKWSAGLRTAEQQD